MKKFLSIVLSLLLFTGCATMGTPVAKSPTDGEVVKLEELLQKSGANVVRAFTCLTGNTTGCLDKILKATISAGDIAMVVTGNIIYFYQFNASNQVAASPTYICPADGTSGGSCTDGTWFLVDVRAKGVNTGTSTLPSITFFDSDAADGDENAKIYVNCTTASSGAEICQMYFQTQIGGAALATKMTINERGALLSILNEVAVASARSITTAEMTGTWMTVDVARALTMPAATVGLSGCLENLTAATFVLTPASGENFVLNGVAKAANATISSPATAGAFVCLHCAVAGTWRTAGMNGTVTSP